MDPRNQGDYWHYDLWPGGKASRLSPRQAACFQFDALPYHVINWVSILIKLKLRGRWH